MPPLSTHDGLRRRDTERCAPEAEPGHQKRQSNQEGRIGIEASATNEFIEELVGRYQRLRRSGQDKEAAATRTELDRRGIHVRDDAQGTTWWHV